MAVEGGLIYRLSTSEVAMVKAEDFLPTVSVTEWWKNHATHLLIVPSFIKGKAFRESTSERVGL